MNRVGMVGILSIVVTTFVFLFYDYFQIIKTPLSPFEISHWIPEFLALVCMGYWSVEKIGSLIMKVICGCVLLYSVLTYSLLKLPLQLGIGTGTFFVAALIVGIWLRMEKS